jgi:hypothetical protein
MPQKGCKRCLVWACVRHPRVRSQALFVTEDLCDLTSLLYPWPLD